MYDQNQQYKEGLQIGEYINVTFGGDHAGTGTVFALPPTNLSGGKDESFKYNVPTLIAGSQKKAGLLGGSGTLPPAVSEILNQEDAIIVVVRVEEDSDETKMRQNVVNGINALLTSAQINQVTPRILIAPD
ncbi:phage tail protein, partial [Escherichia coli]